MLGRIFGKKQAPITDDDYAVYNPQASHVGYTDPFNNPSTTGYSSRNPYHPPSNQAPIYPVVPVRPTVNGYGYPGVPIYPGTPHPGIPQPGTPVYPGPPVKVPFKNREQPIDRSRTAPIPSSHRRTTSESRFRDIPKFAPHEIHFFNRGEKYYEFSNFAEYPVFYEGLEYPTAEHLFQSLKFQDRKDAERIRRCRNAREAAKVAQGMESRIRKDWISRRMNVAAMEKVLICKFTQHEDLANLLLSTGNARIFQDSPNDPFWGTGKDGRGHNQLGVLLMETRSTLKDLYAV